MITARNAKTELPTSLARPSQRVSVAARAKLMIHQCTDADPKQWPSAETVNLAADGPTLSLPQPALSPPQGIEATIKTHRSKVRASV
jgi:hypothetical protein